MLIQLVYKSTPTTKVGAALAQFIPLAKKLNDENDITGLILSDQSAYLQVIEGDKDAIDDLFDKLQHDTRHIDIELIRYSEIETRQFPKWGMNHIPHEESKPLAEYDSPSSIRLLIDALDGKLAKRSTKTIFWTMTAIMVLVVGTFVVGPAIEAEIYPPLLNPTANIVKQDGEYTEIVLIGNRNRERYCRLETVLTNVTVNGKSIHGATNILDKNDRQNERLIAKVVVTPRGESYRIAINNRCHPFWPTRQVIDLKAS